MSQRLIDRVRAKFPQYADVPDDRLTLAIGEKYPQYLEQDGNFARTFDAYRQMRLNDADTAARTSLAGQVGAAVEAGLEGVQSAARTVDRELVAPLTGGTVDQWASAVPEAASLMLRQPVREAGKVFSAAGRLLGDEVDTLTRMTGLDPAGPVARGLRDVGETAPVLAASMGLQRLGVNPAVAFGAPPAVQTYGETGDVAATLKAGATGALIPAVAQVGKLGGAALNRALIERNLLSPAANATQKAVEVLGSQGAVQVFMEGLRLPEYAALDPEARREAIYRNLVANTAFLAMDLPTFKRSVPSETLLRMAPAERVAYGLRDAANNPELVDALQRTADELARQATLPDAAQVEGEGPLFRREAPLGEVPGPRQNTQAAPDSASTVAQRFPGPAADAPGRPLDPFPTDQGAVETVADGKESQAKDAAQMFGLRSSAKTRHEFENAIADAVQAAANGDTIYDPETDVEWSIHHHFTSRGDRVTTVESGGGKSQFQVIQRQNGDRTVSGGKHMAFGRDAVLNSRKQVPGPRQNTQAAPDSASTVAQQKGAEGTKADERPFDPGELNIPGRLQTLDAQIDRGLDESAKAKKASNKAQAQAFQTNKSRAKDLLDLHGKEIEQRFGTKYPKGELRKVLDQMAKWEPARFIKLVEQHIRETASGSPLPASPVLSAPESVADQRAQQEREAAQVEGEGPLFRREAPLGEVPGPRQNTQAAPDSASTVAQRFPGPAADAPGRPLDPFRTDQGVGETVAPDAEWNVVGMGRKAEPPKGGIPELPPMLAEAIAAENRPDVYVEHAVSMFGESARGDAESIKPTVEQQRVLAVARERAKQMGWDWNAVQEKARAQLGLDADFLPKDSRPAQVWKALQERRAEISRRQKLTDEALGTGPKQPETAPEPPAPAPEAKPVPAPPPPPVSKALREEVKLPEAVKQSLPPLAPKEQKKFLLSEIDRALAEAPAESPTEAAAALKVFKAVSGPPAERAAKLAGLFEQYGIPTEQAERVPIPAKNLEGTELVSSWPKAKVLELSEREDLLQRELLRRDLAENNVVIEVPGDGIFTIRNTVAALKDFKERAAKFPTTAAKLKEPSTARATADKVPAKGKADAESIVKIAATHASTDLSREIVNYIWSDGKQTVSTDGRRLLVVEKGIGGTKDKPLLVGPDGKPPRKALDREFPNWRQVIPDAPLATIPDVNIERLWTVVRQASEATDESSKSFRLLLNPDRSLGVQAQAPKAAAYEHNVQADAEPLAAFNAEYMLDALSALRRLGSDTVAIDYIDDRAPIVMRGDNAKVVLMPMRGAESDRGGRGAAKRILEIMGDASAAKPAKTKRAAKKSVAGSPAEPQGQFGLPAIPAGTATAVPSKRMVVTMERLVPGFTTVANIERRLSAIVDVARGIADASPIRSNRLSRRFAGVYTTPSRVVRMWDRLNLPTTAHEVAHALADAIFGTAASRGLRGIPPSVGRELVRLGRNLYGNTRPNAGYAAEGWAELVADYLTTDDIARRAPQATQWLEGTVLPAFPEVAQAMREARAEIDVWRGMGARERMRAQTAPHGSKLARLRTELGRYVGREGLVEQFAPFEALSRRFRQVAGRDLAADEDPFLIASARRGQAGSILAYMADEGMIDPSGNRTGGRSLREALAPVTRGLRPDQVLARNQRAADFWSYLWARRAIERWGLDRNPGISLADAQYLRQTLETPDFQLAASRYYQWWDGVLDYLAASSPANRELVARIRAGSKDYVPLARMLDPNQTRPGEEARLSNALRRMRGSSLPVRMLDVQTLLTAESLIARAHRDQVMEAVFRLANQPGMGAMIEEVPRSQVQEVVNIERLRAQLEGMGVDTTGIPADTLLEYYTGADAPGGSDPIVARRVNGEVRWYYVRPDLYAALEGIQPARLPLVADLLLGVPARLFRLGTTGLRPAFSLFTNPVRDIQTFLMQSTAGVNPLRRVAQYFGALGDIVRSGIPGAAATPYRDLFDRLGIMAGQPLGGDIGYARREARGLFHGRVFKRVTAPVETLRELLSFSEAAPRIAELRLRAQEMGWAPGQPLTPAQAIQLTLAAKRVTTDFSASGSYARLWSQAVPFLNASIQGTRGFLRAMRERPVQATLYGVSMFTLPALWTWWHNKDEEWYQALPWRERYLYWNVPDENGQVYQIPRPPEWNNAFAVIPEALMDAAYRDNPDAVKAAFGHLFATTNPFDLPVLARIAWEQARNRVDFFDRPIVPRAQVDLRPGEQVGPYTSWLATSLGKAFPETISPRRVDHLLRGVGGGTASDTLSAIEQMAGLKAGALRSEPSETPVVGRALRRGGQFSAVNRQLADLYDLHYYWQARARNKELAPELAAYARYVDDQIQMVKFGQRVAEQTEDLKARQSLYRDLTRQAESMLTDAKRLKRLPAQQ